MGYLALDRYRNIEAELSAFCDRWNVSELALLDLPEEERTDPDAELDVLVTIRPDAEWSLFDRVHMQDELSEIFGISPSACKMRVSRAREKLQRKYSDQSTPESTPHGV